MNKDSNNLIVALEIGTSKVVAAVGELAVDGSYRIVGLGQSESKGIKKGVVVNIDATVESIGHAIEQAGSMARCKIRNVYVGICGNHIQSFNSTGMIATKDTEVSAADVKRVLETAKVVTVPHDQQLLHVIPQEFIIDNNDDVREPIGMSGKRLEVRVHIATGSISAVQNVVKCVQRNGLYVSDLVYQPFVSAEAVLTQDEKDLGVVFVDIGGGTTDVAIFSEGAVRHTAVIPIAGDQITNDVAMALHTPATEAEAIKIKYGVADHTLAHSGVFIDVPGIANQAQHKEHQQFLGEVIEARLEELFLMVKQVIVDSGYVNVVPRGIVLTGGTAQLPGMTELAHRVLNKPVRIGTPTYTGPMQEVIQHPRYAAVYGLLLEGKNQLNREALVSLRTSHKTIIWQRIKDWFVGNF
jgi:cell division protein FtsA